jgi:hypothetical protein
MSSASKGTHGVRYRNISRHYSDKFFPGLPQNLPNFSLVFLEELLQTLLNLWNVFCTVRQNSNEISGGSTPVVNFFGVFRSNLHCIAGF